jgi:ppGpp synthetase/RelA/SpoT-type nucleotidyltranferase
MIPTRKVMAGMENLEVIISEQFPVELTGNSKFEEFHDRLLDDIRGPAITVVERLENLLENMEREIKAEEKVSRDHWWLFGDRQPVKPATSARFKLARDIRDFKGEVQAGRPRFTLHEIRERLLAFSDLARCRILSSFNQDVKYLLNRVVRDNRFMNTYPLHGEIKDFVFKPERREILRGHRARQFTFWVGDGETRFLFELQIMTSLQHAWDRRNHPLYEWMRSGKDLPDEIRVNDFACSETLHLVDQQAEQNWKDFLIARKGCQ